MEASCLWRIAGIVTCRYFDHANTCACKRQSEKNDEEISLLASSIRHLSDASIVSIYFNKEQSFAELQQLKAFWQAGVGRSSNVEFSRRQAKSNNYCRQSVLG